MNKDLRDNFDKPKSYIYIIFGLTTKSASPWAKEWKSLASDNSQKAFLLATFYKAFGIWPTDIPQEAVQKLVAGRNPDDILKSRRRSVSLKSHL
jgi:hypothetical protein